MFSKLGLIILAAVFALVPVSSVQANSLVPNETHYYTVQLRSDKRALNYARIVFENKNSESDQDTYKFSLPKGTKVQNLSAQQVLAKKGKDDASLPCKAYESYEEWYARTSQGLSSNSKFQSPTGLQGVYDRDKVCIQYEDATVSPYDEDYDYNNNISSNMYSYRYYNYYDRNEGDFDYSDLKLEEKDGEYTVILSSAVKPGKQGSVLISYIAEDLVTSFLGRYDYNYRTLVSTNMVSNVTVAINFDEEMYSREAKQKRASETSSSREGVSSNISDGAPAAMPSRSTDDLLFSVGRGGVYTKTQSNLLPGDVMSVKGTFAEHPVLLFTKEIFITLLVLAAVVIWSILGARHYRKKHPKVPKDLQSGNSDSGDGHVKSGVDMNSDVNAAPAVLSSPSNIKLGVISLISFFVALVVGVAGAAIVGATAEMFNTSWGIYPLIQITWVLFSYIFIAFLLPLAYVLYYHSTNSVFRWAIIQLIVFAVLGIFVMILGLMLIAVANGGAPEPYYYD